MNMLKFIFLFSVVLGKCCFDGAGNYIGRLRYGIMFNEKSFRHCNLQIIYKKSKIWSKRNILN